jgi:hypothetical protein
MRQCAHSADCVFMLQAWPYGIIKIEDAND